MPSILIPYYALATLSELTAVLDPAYGTIVATFEIKRTVDCDRENYATHWSGSAQPVVWKYSSVTMPTENALLALYPDAFHAIYCRINGNAFDILGADYNYAELLVSDDGEDYTALDIAGYGDGEALGDDKWKLKQTTLRSIKYGEFVIKRDGGDTSAAFYWHSLNLGTENANEGDEYKSYYLIDGLGVPLPDNLSLEESYNTTFFGGDVSNTDLGELHWGGQKAEPQGARKHTLVFSEVTQAQRDTLVNVFDAGCSEIPMLFMRDETNTQSWHLCKWIQLTEREPNAGLFFVEIEVEEL
jgi:hypothetical protein